VSYKRFQQVKTVKKRQKVVRTSQKSTSKLLFFVATLRLVADFLPVAFGGRSFLAELPPSPQSNAAIGGENKKASPQTQYFAVRFG
jgi:hypothetical protein